MELSCLERQALRTDWETLTPNDLGIGMSVNLNEESIAHQDDDTFYTDGLAFYRIVLNAVLYLSSDKAELTAKESPRKEIEDRAKGIASLPKRRKLLQTTGRYHERHRPDKPLGKKDGERQRQSAGVLRCIEPEKQCLVE